MDRKANSNLTNSSSSVTSTPEQGRKGWSSPSGNDYLVPFSDALTDFDGLTSAGDTDHFQSFLRPASVSSSSANVSLNLTSELPFEPANKPVIRKRKLLHLFDEEIMLDKDQLFLKNVSELPTNTLKCKNPHQEALNLLTCPNDWLPENFTKILKDHFVPEIEMFRAGEAAEMFDDLSMPMPWQSDTDSVDDLKRLSLGSLNSSGMASPYMSSIASPFSTPSPQLRTTQPPFTASNTTKSTLDFLLFLQERIPTGEAVYFDTLIEPRRRAVAARAFHHLLELKMSNLLQARQSRPYSRILLELKD